MKYSMMSYTMARYPDFDIKKMLEFTNELQMDGIDFVTLYDKDPKELRKMSDDHGIPVVCHTFHSALCHATAEERQAGVDQAKAGIDAALVLGAPTVMIVTPGREGMSRDEQRNNWIAGLKEVAPYAEQAGINMTIENFPGANSPFVTADDFLKAQAEVPSLKLTYDNGNAASGEDPAESFKLCAKFAVHAHFKDWDIVDEPTDGYRPMLDGKYYTPALIGEGTVDHKACLDAMKAGGFEGCINIEYENTKYNGYDAVRKALEYLRSID